MLKLDVTHQTVQSVYDQLSTDYAAHFPEGASDSEAVVAQPASAQDIAAKAACFKENVKIGFKYIDQPPLAAETLETIQRLDPQLAIDVQKLQVKAVGFFNSLVDMYTKVEALSPTPHGWFSVSVPLPEKKPVVELAVEAKTIKSVKQMSEETLTVSRSQRVKMYETLGLIGFTEILLRYQLKVFQKPVNQPIKPNELMDAKTDHETRKAQIKEGIETTEILFKQLNDTIEYVTLPTIPAQDLETLKRLDPKYPETVKKAQDTCLEKLECLSRHRANVETFLEELDPLKCEERRLAELMEVRASLSKISSGTDYYFDYQQSPTEQPINQILGKPAANAASIAGTLDTTDFTQV